VTEEVEKRQSRFDAILSQLTGESRLCRRAAELLSVIVRYHAQLIPKDCAQSLLITLTHCFANHDPRDDVSRIQACGQLALIVRQSPLHELLLSSVPSGIYHLLDAIYEAERTEASKLFDHSQRASTNGSETRTLLSNVSAAWLRSNNSSDR